jgi:hypothetical protein
MGLSNLPKLCDIYIYISVGERSVVDRSTSVSGYGRSRSENVGLSNENIGENPIPRKPKVSSGRFVRGG